MEKYRMIGKKGEGTFSEVLKCVDVRDGTYWACKNPDEIKNIREIQALRMLSKSPNILQLHEVIYERKNGQLNLIFELMDLNLYELIRNQRNYFTNEKVANFMYQLLKAVDVLHANNFFHRDIKPENILIKGDLLKLADFGSARLINTAQPYTEYISTRWYRAPECLLTNGWYSYEMDIWSTGCVMFEIICLYPLFPGSNEIDQIDKIHDIIGTPSPSLLEKIKDSKNKNIHFNFKPKRGTGIKRFLHDSPNEAADLIKLLCKYDPDQRIDASKALEHPYFDLIKPRHSSKELDQDSLLTNSEMNNSNTKLSRMSRISNDASMMSNSTNDYQRTSFMPKKMPYKYSQKYFGKQMNNNNKSSINNPINRNFSFQLTEISNPKLSNSSIGYTNRSNDLILPKLTNSKNNFNSNNVNTNSVMPAMLSFHANKSSSLNSLITKFNASNNPLPVMAKNNNNLNTSTTKLHQLKFGSND